MPVTTRLMVDASTVEHLGDGIGHEDGRPRGGQSNVQIARVVAYANDHHQLVAVNTVCTKPSVTRAARHDKEICPPRRRSPCLDRYQGDDAPAVSHSQR